MATQPKVLVISSDDAETTALALVLSGHAALASVRDLAQVEGLLEGGDYAAVFCSWTFQMGTWKDALGQVRQRWPDLPVVVFCRTAGEREWVQVLEAGAFDLLVPPYDKLAVLAVLEQAVESYGARRLHRVMA